MGLPWVRLDTTFHHNPKVLDLTARGKFRAAFAYVCSLAYAGQHSTDGYLPEGCLAFIHATKNEAAQLVSAGLWVPSPGGWDINGWDEFQVSDEESRRRRERAQKGAAARWEKERQRRAMRVLPN